MEAAETPSPAAPALTRAVRRLIRLPRHALIGTVRLYQLILSPYLGPGHCRYTPTCSQYAILSLRKYGVVKGVILSVWRILRCNPWGAHGHDPPRWFGEPAEPVDSDEPSGHVHPAH